MSSTPSPRPPPSGYGIITRRWQTAPGSSPPPSPAAPEFSSATATSGPSTRLCWWTRTLLTRATPRSGSISTGWSQISQDPRIQRSVRRSSRTNLRSHRWASIAWCLCCSGNRNGRRRRHPTGGGTSTQGRSRSRTDWVTRPPSCTITARGRGALAGEGSCKRMLAAHVSISRRGAVLYNL